MTFPEIASSVTALVVACMLTIAIVLIARPLVYRFAGTNWTYALWGVMAVPFLAALAPPTVTAPLRVWRVPAETVFDSGVVAILMLSAWLIGVAVSGFLSIRHALKSRQILEGSFSSLSDEEKQQIQVACSRASVFPPPNTVTSSLGVGPAVMIGRSPTLVLPSDFFRKYSLSERNLVLHHELIHIRRYDLVWNVLFRCLRCALWFVPFMKRCEAMFRSDQERSCDHSVVCDEPAASRVKYAQALYKTTAPTSSYVGAIGFQDDRHELLVRTELLAVHRRSMTQSIAGFVVLLICVLLSVAVSASPRYLESSPIPSSGWCGVYDRFGQ